MALQSIHRYANTDNDRTTIDMCPPQPFHIDSKSFTYQQHRQIYIAVDTRKSLRNTPLIDGNRILGIGLIAGGGCWGYVS